MDEMAQNIGVDGKVVNIAAIKRQKKSDKPKVYESDVVNACIKWLHAQGAFYYRNNTGAYKPEGGNSFIRYGCPGSPDIIVIRNTDAKYIGIECKSDTGKLSEKQEAFRDRLVGNSGVYIVARGIDDLEKNKAEILGQKNLPTA